MKVTLIHPPMLSMTDRRVSPPLGILYLASYLKNNIDVGVEIIDQNLNEDVSIDYCVKQAIESEGDLYGISFGTPQYNYAVAISRAVKHAYPSAPVICGGPHPTALPHETIVDTNCDAIVEAEGENTFCQFVKQFDLGNLSMRDIKGIHFFDESDNLVYTGPRPFIKNLDTIPFPARDLVDFDRYTRTINGEPATTIITARGCPGRCIFCSQHSWRKTLRLRSVENIMAEIDHIYDAWGIKNILFLDDTLTVNHKRIFRLCDELKKRNVTWRGWTRANMVTEELVDKMSESNCLALCIGVESGSQRILDNLHKGTTIEENRKAIQYIKNSGMYARISIIVGSPGETWDTVQESIDFTLETQPDDWLLSIFVPVPGSEAYTESEKYGISFLHSGNRIDYYSNFFVIGGEMMSGLVMEYEKLRSQEILDMRNYAYETLMEKCPPKLHRAEGIK
jgi:anaerobic magnesium-protoporphyrin IX monomethyl ester cyclase